MCNQIVAWFISAQIKSLHSSGNYSVEKLIDILKKKKNKENKPTKQVTINRLGESIVRIC